MLTCSINSRHKTLLPVAIFEILVLEPLGLFSSKKAKILAGKLPVGIAYIAPSSSN